MRENSLRCRYSSKDCEFVDVDYSTPPQVEAKTPTVNAFYAVRSNGHHCIGMITFVRMTADESEIQLQLMRQTGKDKNGFNWPEPPNFCRCNTGELIMKVEPPITAK